MDGRVNDDLSTILENELEEAARSLTDNLYHYTSADTAIDGILRSKVLRLSPFSSTNDLWETNPIYPTIVDSGNTTEEDMAGLVPELWGDLHREWRLKSKVACFTQDWACEAPNEHAFRGWAHLSTWAHYGANHTGVALRFDKETLLRVLAETSDSTSRVFSGPVQYRALSHATGPNSIDVAQVREFGVDAVALEFASRHKEAIFLEKHEDWSPESEYRLVRMDQSRLPFELDISDALTGVVVGQRFADTRIPALREALAGYSGIEVSRAVFHNRGLILESLEPTAGSPARNAPPWDQPTRTDSLNDRTTALRQLWDEPGK